MSGTPAFGDTPLLVTLPALQWDPELSRVGAALLLRQGGRDERFFTALEGTALMWDESPPTVRVSR